MSSQDLPSRVGVERSKVQIQFKDINYEAEVLIGSSGLPSVGNSFKKLLQVGFNPAMLSLSYNNPMHMLESDGRQDHMPASCCAAERGSAGR